MTAPGLEMTAPFPSPQLPAQAGGSRRGLAIIRGRRGKGKSLLQQVGCLTNWTHNETKGTEEGDLVGLDLYLWHAGRQIFVQYLSRVSGQENWQSMHK